MSFQILLCVKICQALSIAKTIFVFVAGRLDGNRNVCKPRGGGWSKNLVGGTTNRLFISTSVFFLQNLMGGMTPLAPLAPMLPAEIGMYATRCDQDGLMCA